MKTNLNLKNEIIQILSIQNNVSRKSAELIYNFAFDEFHKKGSDEIKYFCLRLGSLVEDIIETDKHH